MATINNINNKTGPLTITDSSDTSKAIVFDVSAVTTSTTRTLTMDDRDINFDAVPTTVGTDGSDCTPAAGKFNIVGSGAVSTSASGDTITVTGTGGSSSVAFLATLNSVDSNVTGVGVDYKLGTNVALTEVFDLGGDFNTNGTFTAPSTGKYQFNFLVYVYGIVNASDITASIIATSRVSQVIYDVPSSATRHSSFVSALIDMTSGDTCIFRIMVTGEASNIIDLPGSANQVSVSGFLI